MSDQDDAVRQMKEELAYLKEVISDLEESVEERNPTTIAFCIQRLEKSVAYLKPFVFEETN